jgi:hypothetical protein
VYISARDAKNAIYKAGNYVISWVNEQDFSWTNEIKNTCI